MAELKHTKSKILRNVISCVLYIIVLSFVLVLYGIVEDIIFKRHSLPLNDPGYWIEQFQNNVHSFIFYLTCQFIAASLIIRNLAFKKLFVLTFIGIVISHLLEPVLPDTAFLFFSIFVIIVLSYVVPILILFLISVPKKPSSESEAEMQQQAIDDIKSINIRYWYVLDIILFVLILCWGTLSDPFGLVFYICGLVNKLDMAASLTFLSMLLLIPVSLSLLVLISRMFISWPKYIINKRRLLWIRLFTIFGVIFYLILPYMPFKPSGMKFYIAGFNKYISSNADISGIRNWLETLNSEDYKENKIINTSDGNSPENPDSLEHQGLPVAIANLHPRFVQLSLDGNKKPQVRLNWGSGFLGTWGVVVGNEQLLIPVSDLSWGGEYRKEIDKGIYLFYEIN